MAKNNQQITQHMKALSKEELLALPQAKSEAQELWDEIIVVPTDKPYADNSEISLLAVVGVSAAINSIEPRCVLTYGDILELPRNWPTQMRVYGDCMRFWCFGKKLRVRGGGGIISILTESLTKTAVQ